MDFLFGGGSTRAADAGHDPDARDMEAAERSCVPVVPQVPLPSLSGSSPEDQDGNVRPWITTEDVSDYFTWKSQENPDEKKQALEPVLQDDSQRSACAACCHETSEVAFDFRADVWAAIGDGVNHQISNVVNLVGSKMKEDLHDPKMPHALERGIDVGIDLALDEFKFYLKREIMNAVAIQEKFNFDREDEKVKVNWRLFSKFRAWYLYTWAPFDLSFWDKFYDPWQKLMFVIPLIPYGGANNVFYAFHYFMIDKTDGFQLVDFILGLKAYNFIVNAIMMMFIGTGFLSECALIGFDDCHISDNAGLHGAGFGFVLGYGMLVLGWFLGFMAMAGIYRSHLKGEYKYARKAIASQVNLGDEHKETVDCMGRVYHPHRAWKLRYLLWYDTVCIFIAAIAAVAGTAGMTDFFQDTVERGTWNDSPFYSGVDVRWSTWMFLIVIAYGWTSVPFFIIWVAELHVIVTKALPTAYNKWGKTVRKMSARERVEREKEVEAAKKAKFAEEAKEIVSARHAPQEVNLAPSTTADGQMLQEANPAPPSTTPEETFKL